jgi:predicted phosphodiesterase
VKVDWLHISDFHLREGDRYDRDVVLKALIQRVKSHRDEGRKTDFIFATGDVACSGKAAEYALATEMFDRLLEAAGLKRERLFVVPGNHDVDRAREGLIRTLSSRESADSYFRPGAPIIHIAQRQAHFVAWYDQYFKGIRTFPQDSTCGPVEVVNVRDVRIAVVPINSALFCQGDDDHTKLWIGRRCLDAALDLIPPLQPHLKIALLHHPLDWLHDAERTNIKSKLAASVDLVLRGHLHDSEAEVVSTMNGGSLHLAAGATYQTRMWPNRALYGSFEDGEIRVLPIRYEDSPGEVWTVDPSLFPRESGYEGQFRIPRLTRKATGANPPAAAPGSTNATAVVLNAKHDVFISYLASDDVPSTGKQGRISALASHLRASLAMALGRSTDDISIGQSATFSREVFSEISRSAIVVIAASSAYLRSEWCQGEDNQFLRLLGLRPQSVLVLEMTQIEREEMPIALKDREAFRFWTGNAEGRSIRPLGASDETAGYDSYFGRIEDVARRIAARIGPGGGALSASTLSSRTPAIFLAEVTDDLDEKRDQVRRHLEQAGIRVVPAGDFSLPADGIGGALRVEMAKSRLFVQLLGPFPGKKTPSAPRGLPRLQYDCAVEAKLPVVQWKALELDIANVMDEEHRRFLLLESVKKQSLPEFSEAVLAQMRQLSRPPPSGIPGARVIFVDFEMPNRKPVEILSALDELKAIYAWPQGDRAAWRKMVKRSDGVVVVYEANPGWTTSRWIECLKTRSGSNKGPDSLAIYSGPPATKPDLPLGGQTVRVIDGRSRLDKAALLDFLDRLNV